MTADRNQNQDQATPTLYPALRHAESGLGQARRAHDIMPSPPGLLKAMVLVVACAAIGYVAFSSPTEAEEKTPPAKAEQQADKADKKDAKPDAAAAAPQAMPISVAVVPAMEITEYSDFSGRLQAVEDVSVRPRVSGAIDAVHFNEGDMVQKGDKLFTIDLRPFKAADDTADAAVTAAQAQLNLAQRDLKRAKGLLAERALSQREFDERQTAYDNAMAVLKGAQAQKELTALDLEYAEVRAPVSGRVGRPDITVGNIVRANEDVLTTLQSINPIYVDFDVDEQTYLSLMKSVRIDGKAADMPVSMGLADESDFPRQGRIKSFDNHLAEASGTIRVRAEFDNTDGLLTPGLFAHVRLGGADKQQAVIINDAAISTDQSKRFVYVVDDKGMVQYRQIELGALHPLGRIVASGLKPGEKIIVNGLLRVHPGMQVTPMIVDMTTLKPAGAPADGAPPADAPAPAAE